MTFSVSVAQITKHRSNWWRASRQGLPYILPKLLPFLRQKPVLGQPVIWGHQKLMSSENLKENKPCMCERVSVQAPLRSNNYCPLISLNFCYWSVDLRAHGATHCRSCFQNDSSNKKRSETYHLHVLSMKVTGVAETPLLLQTGPIELGKSDAVQSTAPDFGRARHPAVLD